MKNQTGPRQRKDHGDGPLINENIRVPVIRLILDDGQNEEVETRRAVQMARDQGMDLVVVAENASPPVCKILDYGKFRYNKQKQDKEAAAKSRASQVLLKELKMKPTIDENDLLLKLRQARKFISEGDKVKLTVKFRGREVMHSELGTVILQRFIDDLEDVSGIEQRAMMTNRQMIAILGPKKK